MTDNTVDGLYVGRVFHERFHPKSHKLSYGVFQVLLDIDKIEETIQSLKTFSHNRFNLFGFYDRDHGPDQATARHKTLASRMKAFLSEAGHYNEGDRIYLLSMPRILGFVFNPISVYYILGHTKKVRAVAYEVNNTFGDRHTYLLENNAEDDLISQSQTKLLHVSPFMEMDLRYEFRLTRPSSVLDLHISVFKGDLRMLIAAFHAKRQTLNDAELIKAALRLPFMTLGVVAAIHWEALLLFSKGLGLKPKPLTQKSSVSVK